MEKVVVRPDHAAVPGFVPDTPAQASPVDRHAVEFTATAGEYFRIWIVNLALTVVTLGIYSAWAKVRKKRYFYGHTRIAGDHFEYRGNPLAILKGRLLAVVVAGGVYFAANFAPLLLLAVLGVAVFALPWLIVRSMAFNAHNSAFRNVRFRFRGTYGRALAIVVGYGLLTVFTLGLGYFFFKVKITEFIVRHHSYGATPFDTKPLKKAFFDVYGKMIGMGIVLGIVLTGFSSSLIAMMEAPPTPGSPVDLGLTAITYVFYIGIYAFVRAGILNATWNNASLGPITFESTLRPMALYRLYLENVFAILATVGLATPWAVVRLLRYRAANFTVISIGPLATFAAASGADVAAGGEEVGEMLDIDFSL
jgi:uncharacterized membrane protein YjgN (DUF898 family)